MKLRKLPLEESLFEKIINNNLIYVENLYFLINKKYSLKIEDGLGEYLVKLGIAKPFLAYSEWKERIYLSDEK